MGWNVSDLRTWVDFRTEFLCDDKMVTRKVVPLLNLTRSPFAFLPPVGARVGAVILSAALLATVAVGCRNTDPQSDEPEQPTPEPDAWQLPGPGTPSPDAPSPESPNPDSNPEPEAAPSPSPDDEPDPTPEGTPDDLDGDAIANAEDNCPDDFNPLQTDFDEDGIGNECDPDTDNDGSLNADDCSPLNASIYPGATEILGNATDEDCDGTAQSWIDAPVDCSALDCDGTGADPLLCAMELCFPDHVLNAFVVSPTGDDVSASALPLDRYGDSDNDLVPYLGSYTFMGTGTPNSSHQDRLSGGNPTIDEFSASSDSIYDVVEMSVRMTAPPGVGGFAVDYIFFSAEYEEWIGSEYNDKFYIVLNAPDTTGGEDRIINFTTCSNPDSYSDFEHPEEGPQCYIAINTAFSERCNAPVDTDIGGTNFECNEEGSSTGWLTTTWTINPGETFELTFHIHDTADEVEDSAVLLDHFRWVGTGAKPGTE